MKGEKKRGGEGDTRLETRDCTGDLSTGKFEEVSQEQ